MEKFLKSIFTTSERKKVARFDNEDDKNDFNPPLDGRRKLSISRSGRMKANKKRHSLSTDLYGQNVYQQLEKPKTLEYHVNNPYQIADQQRRKSTDRKIDQHPDNNEQNNNRKELTPEEEIESAFEIIDKIS